MQVQEHTLFEGIVHPEIKIISLIAHPYVIPNQQDLCSSSEHKLRYFLMKSESFRTLQRQQRNYGVERDEQKFCWHEGDFLCHIWVSWCL